MRRAFHISSTLGSRTADAHGFTLVEIMVASIAAALILIAIYGIFYRAVNMRDNATEATRETRLRVRAATVIRNDLRNALISGGILASTLEGDSSGSDPDSTDGSSSGFPGYLKFTTTTGKDSTGSDSTSSEMYGDVQQVEYYITKDKTSDNGNAGNGGTLVRMVSRDLLDTPPNITHEEQILTDVQSLQVSFYDGTTWQTSWSLSGSSSSTGSGTSSTTATSSTGGTTSSGSNQVTLPEAVRIDIQQAPHSPKFPAPPPLEILVPWVNAPFLSGTNFVIGTGTTGTGSGINGTGSTP